MKISVKKSTGLLLIIFGISFFVTKFDEIGEYILSYIFGITCIIFGIKFIIKKDDNSNETITKNNKDETIENNIEKKDDNLLYEMSFKIDECELYKDNINKIISVSKEDIELYDGLSNKEIREKLEYFVDEIGEIDSQETPDIKLFLNEAKTTKYISIKMYHKDFDKYLTIGKIPKEFEAQIIPFLNKNILIWGSFIGGKFKTLDDDKIKTIQKPISIELRIKIFNH